VFEKLGGFEKVTLGLYQALIRKGEFDLAAELMADTEARCQHPDPEIARMYADVLARMKHEV